MNPKFTVQQLIEAGVHYGHKKNLWNPKMSQYIRGVRGGMHIINLKETYYMLHAALDTLRAVAAKGGKILFVSTKKQASESIAEGALKCGQHYVNHRWPGGMLTNWNTVSRSLRTLNEYKKQLEAETSILTKKERLDLAKKKDKLELMLGGIKNMAGVPDLIFVIDTNEQRIAIQEANKLGIPVIAIVDTNASLDGVSWVVPGNDDGSKAIKLYMTLAQEAVLEGIQQSLIKAGVDIGASENAVNAIEDSAH